MANEEQLARLKENVEDWNSWRVWNKGYRINLSFADLVGVNLSGANLSGVDLSGAHLIAANLSGSQLTDAKLRSANLIGANLSYANLVDADLSNAKLTGTQLAGANLTGAVVFETVFIDTNLSNAVGLDALVHPGPSAVDHRTLAKSGSLSIAFLRGCGFPENLITYLPSILNEAAIRFYSCFISYSTKDQDFADRLHADLQNKGVRCWFAPHDMAAGKKLHEQIDEAIRVYDRLLLILSEHSMNSRWVKTEIANARKKESTENRKVLFPISLVDYEVIRSWKLFNADAGDDSAAEVREYFIPDFRNWDKDHAAYKEAFGRLVRDLQAKETAAAKA